MFELQSGPGHQFGVGAHARPGSGVVYLLLEIGHGLVAVGFGIEIVAHLDEQSHVLIRAETCIQAELCFNRFGVGGIVLLKTQQTLVEDSELGLLLAPLGRGLVQAELGLLAGRRSTGCAFDDHLQALARLGQAAGRAFCPLAGLVVLFELIHLLLVHLHLLLCRYQQRLGLLHSLLLLFQSLAGLGHHLLECGNALAE